MVGYAIRGWVVSQGVVCTIWENPLSMDGLFLEWVRFPAMDKWLIAFIKF